MSEEKIILRVFPYERPDGSGYWSIRALLPAKTKQGAGRVALPNNNPDQKSWQVIHRSISRSVRDKELSKLLATGKYKMEEDE